MADHSSTTFPIPGIISPLNALRVSGRNTSNSPMIPSPANVTQNIITNSTMQPSNVINLFKSSRIVIGPMTQYQGPVTIYQSMDATVEGKTTHTRGGFRQQSNTTEYSTKLLQWLSTNSTILIVFILIIIISVGVAIYFTSARENNKPRPIVFGTYYEIGTFPNLAKGHEVIDRDQWGASDHELTKRLEHPVPYVLITHVGDHFDPCVSLYECGFKLRKFQNAAIAKQGLPDINSNFYVGNDGNIYVGRGWNYTNSYGDKSLAICFIGDFSRYKPSNESLEAIKHLLRYGTTNKYLALDYKLIGQHQTQDSKSPGTYVIREICKWPHWYPCGLLGNPACGTEISLPEIWDAKQ